MDRITPIYRIFIINRRMAGFVQINSCKVNETDFYTIKKAFADMILIDGSYFMDIVIKKYRTYKTLTYDNIVPTTNMYGLRLDA